MSDLSDYLENELLDHIMTNIGGGAWTAPAALYVKLHTGSPGDDGTTNAATETTRTVCGNFSAASGGATDNDAAITWTSVSTSETYSHISIWDNATAGNCLFVGALSSSVAVTAGDDFEIAAGQLSITLA